LHFVDRDQKTDDNTRNATSARWCV